MVAELTLAPLARASDSQQRLNALTASSALKSRRHHMLGGGLLGWSFARGRSSGRMGLQDSYLPFSEAFAEASDLFGAEATILANQAAKVALGGDRRVWVDKPL